MDEVGAGAAYPSQSPVPSAATRESRRPSNAASALGWDELGRVGPLLYESRDVGPAAADDTDDLIVPRT